MQLRKKILLSLSVSLIVLTGCSSFGNTISINALDKNDIFSIPKNSKIIIYKDSVMKDNKGKIINKWDSQEELTVTKQGKFISDHVIKEIMRVKLDQ